MMNSTKRSEAAQFLTQTTHKTMSFADNFLAAFQLLDEHNTMAFNYWETILFDEDGEWIEKEMTEANLFSMRMDACCAAGVVLCEV
jgi:hypothetical protein